MCNFINQFGYFFFIVIVFGEVHLDIFKFSKKKKINRSNFKRINEKHFSIESRPVFGLYTNMLESEEKTKADSWFYFKTDHKVPEKI